MSDLQPTPMSLFNEITDINNFNGDSKIPFLDANATSVDKINAIIKYKNFSKVILNEILPIQDSSIQTGINPANLNTGLLSNITQFQVNQYGRVVRVDGNTSESSGSVTSNNFDVGNIVSTSSRSTNLVASQASNYQAVYSGKISITGIVTYRGNGVAGFPVSMGIKSNIKQVAVPLTAIVLNTYEAVSSRQTGQPLRFGCAVYVSGIIPCTAGETNWLVELDATVGNYEQLTTNLTSFNYAQ